MRIVFSIEVGIDVPSYVQAGEVLDKVTQNLEEIIGPKGSYDVGNFRARHKSVHEFAGDQSMGAMETPMMKQSTY